MLPGRAVTHLSSQTCHFQHCSQPTGSRRLRQPTSSESTGFIFPCAFARTDRACALPHSPAEPETALRLPAWWVTRFGPSLKFIPNMQLSLVLCYAIRAVHSCPPDGSLPLISEMFVSYENKQMSFKDLGHTGYGAGTHDPPTLRVCPSPTEPKGHPADDRGHAV